MAVVLIGPMFAGKSTVAPLLAAALGRNHVGMDDVRRGYYEEIGYSPSEAQRRLERGGFAERHRYWRPFEAHAVERILADHPSAVIDLGAGHSVYEDAELFDRVAAALEPHSVVLLLPTAEPRRSLHILRARMKASLEDTGAAIPEGLAELNEHFVRHPSNNRLADHTISTHGRTPEQTAADIAAWLVRDTPS